METFWKFKATNVVQNSKVTWECVAAHHVHAGISDIEKEWLGTRVHWNLSEKNGDTEMEMIHEGLVPGLNCYNICKEGWDYYFVKSLKNYLDKN